MGRVRVVMEAQQRGPTPEVIVKDSPPNLLLILDYEQLVQTEYDFKL